MRPRSGLTLLELVAASLLAAMLCVAVLGMMASSARRHRIIINQTPARPWISPLAEQVRWDVLQSRSFRIRPNALELHGFASRDFGTGVAYHGPTVITYQIVKDGEVSWLLRKELHVDDLSSKYFRIEFVCADVGGLRLSVLSGQDASRQKAASFDDWRESAEEQELKADGPLPERVVITIRGITDKAPLIREVICRR